jgi:GNAT superfamily N-acetyltransferase
LKEKEIKMSDISILSAHDVDTKLLIDFYRTMYPRRVDSLSHIWKWLNRSSFYQNRIPLVILYNARVIAHAGMIPFNVFLDRKRYTASWFIDFAVLPEFQGHGLALLLTEKWMEFSDLYVTFCNEKSMGVFKRYGWIESFDTYLHHYFLMPFNHPKFAGSIPRFLRRTLNMVSSRFLKLIYHKYAYSIDKLHLSDLNSDSFSKFLSFLEIQSSTVIPIRDSDYISWRLLNSPDRDKYFVLSMSGGSNISIVTKLGNKGDSKYIDLLWVSDPSEYSIIRCMISTLALWGMSNGYSYIRYYTSNKELSSYLAKSLKPFVKHPRFAFYSKDAALLQKLTHPSWHWQLIDSDFEEL